MIDNSAIGHTVTIEARVKPERALAFLRDPLMLGRWALGCQDSRPSPIKDVYLGRSLFNGEESHFKISCNEELKIVDYYLGEPGQMQPRISARLIPGPVTGRGDEYCLVSLSAWREAAMSDERWHQLCVCHETEIILLKSLLERL